MIISQIEAWQPTTPGSPQDWRTQLGQIVVEVTTSDGTIGIGVGGGGSAGIHIIRTVLRERLVGMDIDHPADAHATMCQMTGFYGRKGLVPMAISGVDLAIWDAYAKASERSIYELLRSDVPARDSCSIYSTVFDEKEARSAINNGNRDVKLHVERFGSDPDPSLIIELVARTRGLIGDVPAIMIDAFGGWNVARTLAIAEQLTPFDVSWIEEPLMPDNVEGYRELCLHSPIPIAGGEHEYLIEGFTQIADNLMHDVLQPDVNWCGGLTTLIEIYKLADERSLRVVPHRGSEPFALPAILALDRSPIAESPRRWFNVFDPPVQIVDGRARCNHGPGFGVSIKRRDNGE
ncbi:MAG: enolase C-terminal domain-like protein [Planctomycetota bacterium]|nr:enolase C-terminal domain-like protein [Planctomycetota bacterium]